MIHDSRWLRSRQMLCHFPHHQKDSSDFSHRKWSQKILHIFANRNCDLMTAGQASTVWHLHFHFPKPHQNKFSSVSVFVHPQNYRNRYHVVENVNSSHNNNNNSYTTQSAAGRKTKHLPLIFGACIIKWRANTCTFVGRRKISHQFLFTCSTHGMFEKDKRS